MRLPGCSKPLSSRTDNGNALSVMHRRNRSTPDVARQSAERTYAFATSSSIRSAYLASASSRRLIRW